MGVYSTDTLLDPAMTEWILRHIAEPTIQGMAEEGTPFAGVLYCGLMMTARGPQVLEFNARFGDPETQAILVRLESDLVDALEACIDGRLAEVLIALGPGRVSLRRRQFRRLSRQLQNRLADHRPRCRGASSRRPGLSRRHGAKDGQVLTAGGRVLGVTAAADSLPRRWPALTRPWKRSPLKGCIIGATSDIAH